MSWFKIDPAAAKLTDWIEAAGSVIAIIAAVIGFVKLFLKDKKREQEVRSLTHIAETQQQHLQKMQQTLEETQKQTEQLVIQSGEMRESNRLYKRHVELLSDSIEHNKVHQQQLLEIRKAERKNDIRPRFKWSNQTQAGIQVTSQLQLVQNIAYFHSIRNYTDSVVVFHANIPEKKAIGTNQTITIDGAVESSVNTQAPQFVARLSFKYDLLFRDEYHNLYYQTVSRNDISQPEEISEPLPADQR